MLGGISIQLISHIADSPKERTMKRSEEEVREFIVKQKRRYAAGLLHSREIKKLEKIPGWTWKMSEKEMQTFRAEQIGGEACGHRHKTLETAAACGIRTFHSYLYRVVPN